MALRIIYLIDREHSETIILLRENGLVLKFSSLSLTCTIVNIAYRNLKSSADEVIFSIVSTRELGEGEIR